LLKPKQQGTEKELSVQINQSPKEKLLVWIHPMSLEPSLLQEPSFPGLKGGQSSIEDEVVPLFPDQPGTYHEGLHKERIGELLPCICHHAVKIQAEVSVDV
jgi:hypothetical protein